MSFLKNLKNFFSGTTEPQYTETFEATHAQFVEAFEGFSGDAPIDETFYQRLKQALLASDVGFKTTQHFILTLQKRVQKERTSNVAEALKSLSSYLIERLSYPETAIESAQQVILLVGVNGSGKTTSAAKMAARFKTQGQRVVLVAADTFRAGAVLQLKSWAERIGVACYAAEAQSDPASVIVDGLRYAQSVNADVTLIDTAGRLESKQQLMQELSKMTRVVEKVMGRPADQVLLVLDASTGQNALDQAEAFISSAQVNGLICTKMDSSAKGGVLLALNERFHVPIVLIGVGERLEDLVAFDAQRYVNALLRDVYVAE